MCSMKKRQLKFLCHYKKKWNGDYLINWERVWQMSNGQIKIHCVRYCFKVDRKTSGINEIVRWIRVGMKARYDLYHPYWKWNIKSNLNLSNIS